MFTDEELDNGSKKYAALALRYRPRSFADVIGQDIFVRTLRNAFILNKIGNAFILSGIRGVGKTTTARIIALALNCSNIKTDGCNTYEPCGECQNCRMIISGHHQDVIEIDAASHTGVDDIRAVTESARYAPLSAKYKVFIIDEVHMLSNSAFNALLKTLEEPPHHTKFVFATTEMRKIPHTILSRCQKFDLRPVEYNVLLAHYAKIIEKEGYVAEEEAIGLIVQAAAGSVRDGLSILDQALSSVDQGKLLSASNIRDLLGMIDEKYALDIIRFIYEGNVNEALQTISEVQSKGGDPMTFLQDILYSLHVISRVKISGTKAIKNTHLIELIAEMSNNMQITHIIRIWQILLNSAESLKLTTDQYIALEMAIIKACHIISLPSLDDIINGKVNVQKMITEARDARMNKETDGGIKSSETCEIPRTIREIAMLLLQNNEMLMYHIMVNELRLISLNEYEIKCYVPTIYVNDFKQLPTVLSELTKVQWKLILVKESEPEFVYASPSLYEQEKTEKLERENELRNSTLVEEIEQNFTK